MITETQTKSSNPVACRHVYKPTNTPCGAKPGEPCQWQGFERGIDKMFHDERMEDAAVSIGIADVAA